MLHETFLFLPGVQGRTERMLWEEGIATWSHLLDTGSVRGVSRERLSFWKTRIRQAEQLVSTDEGMYRFCRLLGARNVWRAYKELMGEPRFLDIETAENSSDVTVVGVSDGEFYQAFVNGINLDTHALRKAFEGATCIVTFNGSSFDLPIIEKVFPSVLPRVPHIDVRHVCAQAGIRGGLKQIERDLLVRRAGTVRDLDGTDAVLLWYRYKMGERGALQELVDYNAADVLNLLPILEQVIPALWRHVRQDDPLPFSPLYARSIK